jgi:hypothetical protein
MMLTSKRLVFLLTIVSAVASVPAWSGNYIPYCNERYGFCVEHPSTLMMDPPPANGDGRRFYDPNGFSMVVSGINNVLDDTVETEMKSQAKDVERITYRTKGRKWFVLSGHKGSDVVYLKTYVGGGAINHLSIKYPVKKGAEYAEIAARISRSFKPGDLAAAH